MIETADKDDDKYIDREEFLDLVEKYSRELEKIQRNNFLKYMRIAAYADEYRLVENLVILFVRFPQVVASSCLYHPAHHYPGHHIHLPLCLFYQHWCTHHLDWTCPLLLVAGVQPWQKIRGLEILHI